MTAYASPHLRHYVVDASVSSRCSMISCQVVLVCPSLSVGSHARSSAEDPRPGWWEAMIGSGAAAGIDTDHFRIICPR